MSLFFNYPSSLKHPEDHFSLICSINISWRRSNSWKCLCWMNSRLQFTYQCCTCCIFDCVKAQHSAFQLILSSRGSCRPSEGSPRPHANFFCYIQLNTYVICWARKPSLSGHWPETCLLSGTLITFTPTWSQRVSYTTCTTYTKMSSLSRIWVSDSLRVNTLWNLWLYTSVTTICESKRQQQLHELSENRWVSVILSNNKIVLWFPHNFFPVLQVG